MVRLIRMSENEYEAFIIRAVREYAEEKVKAGNWAPEESGRRSSEEFARLLPKGVATPDNHLFSIVVDEKGATNSVGVIWLAIRRMGSTVEGYIYDLYVDDPYRGKGIATLTMHALEKEAVALGVQRLLLHVFGHNVLARALYEKLGYQITNINMAKSLL